MKFRDLVRRILHQGYPTWGEWGPPPIGPLSPPMEARPPLGLAKKIEMSKMNKSKSFSNKNNIISLQKNFQPNWSFLRPAEFPLKFGSDPLKGKKNCSDYGVHGIQIDRL